jgi:hypothetical protein
VKGDEVWKAIDFLVVEESKGLRGGGIGMVRKSEASIMLALMVEEEMRLGPVWMRREGLVRGAAGHECFKRFEGGLRSPLGKGDPAEQGGKERREGGGVGCLLALIRIGRQCAKTTLVPPDFARSPWISRCWHAIGMENLI